MGGYEDMSTDELYELYDECEAENNVGGMEEVQTELDRRFGL